ncbi:lysoplasmalogenase [Flaviaesturariibacter terrae]
MKRLYWILFFLLALVTDCVFIYMNDDGLRVFSKPLLLLLLAAMVVSTTPRSGSYLKGLLLAALGASWLGDLLLLRDSELFFLLGVGAFFLAQVGYALAFVQLRRQKNMRFRPLMLVPVVTYYICLIALLFDHLKPALRVPVLVYGLGISAMLAMALQLVRLKNRRSAGLIFGGALLFIASDSVLALSKFYWKESSTGSGLVVMATYGLAQLFLSLGLLNHISTPRVVRKSPEAMRQELLN